MAVSNSLAKKPPVRVETTEYMANGMKVTLTPGTVKNYLVSGDKDRVSDQEVAMFINLCRFTGLNPWLREAYCIKYGNEPATLVVGKDAYLKRAEANETYDGMEAGIIIRDESGLISYRQGTLKLDNISTHTPLAGRDRYILCNVQSYIPHLEADKIYKYILSDFCVKFISFFRRTFLRFCNHLMFALMVI